MIDLSKRRVRYVEVCKNYSNLYKYTTDKERNIISSGVMNFIWNNWNGFWRDYWLCYVSGGIGFKRNTIVGIHPKYDDKQSCHFLLYQLGKKKNHTDNDRIIGSYQEATWGDPQNIQKIAFEFIKYYPEMKILLGLLSSYQKEIEHFQKIRNTFIHLNKDNIEDLRKIVGYYSLPPSNKLIDILESKSLISGKPCFYHLSESMQGFLLNI